METYALILLCMRYSFIEVLAVFLIPKALYALIIRPCMRCGVCVMGGTPLKNILIETSRFPYIGSGWVLSMCFLTLTLSDIGSDKH